jgi:diacylglycerol kinase family enzyme
MMKASPLLLNRNGGTVLRLGEEALHAMIESSPLSSFVSAVHFAGIADMEEALNSLARDNPHGVLVGGGDGTALYAAEKLAETKTPFGIVPLGTMNLLARDLGAAATLEDTLQRFERFSPARIDAGDVNGRLFLCAAVIGFVPEGAVAREELRSEVSIESLTRFLSTIRRGIGGQIRNDLVLKSKEDDKGFPLNTTSLIIANNAFAHRPGMASPFAREALDTGRLAVYSAAPAGMMDGLKMALSMWQGNWQNHDSITSFEMTELIVDCSEKNMLVSLDGEPVEIESPLRFSVRAKAVPVLRMELSS